MRGRFGGPEARVPDRHTNPWSAWSRLVTAPLVLVPIWTRRWRHAIPVAAWLVANPVIFPPPADDRAWSTRAMLGEREWIAERPTDTALAINLAASAAGLAGVLAARKRRAAPTALAVAAQLGLQLGYWRLMAQYYARNERDHAQLPQDP
ncbi:hypothetical protein EV191_10621 [Tamaricihabitans halophyticus]|uniref:Uncharacterized protein n=1 Tax=Tamaricihabitans halophyticus TaxID=1262583 RepID=A0A4R2QQH9_9PSEU|nr:DUF6653 family protein [Tamaricihabitans halophyticus]TCP51857.1 hypothetical protein EV191_10621 [Tamaricihabitans halophyticus]